MILTCPKCESRFTLAAEVLAPEGKRVKCSACQEIWFELPDPDELLEELEHLEDEELQSPEVTPDDVIEEIEGGIAEDIPESVKPLPEDTEETDAEEESGEEESQKEPENITIVLLSALLMFLLLATPLIALKGTIMNAWPESIAFYSKLGMTGDLLGEGVVFDQMRAEIKDGKFILTGQVINLTSNDSKLPLIEVSLKDKDANDISHHYIKLPKNILIAEETLPIKAEYDIKDPAKIYDASIRFVIKAKNEKGT